MSRVSKKNIEELMEKDLLLKDLANELGISQAWTIKLIKKYDLKYDFKKNKGSNSYWKGKTLSKDMKDKISKTKKEQNLKAYNRLERKIITCPICQNSFETVPDAKNRSLNKKYCSSTCSSKARSKAMKSKPINKIKVKCDNCGRDLYKFKSLIRKTNFCSYDCCNSYRSGKSYNDFYGEEKANNIKTKIAIQTIDNNKNMPIVTRPHLILKSKLIELKLYEGFKTSHRLGWYEIDEFNDIKKLCIEIDGNYWHGNPEIYKDKDLNEMQIKRRISDKRKNTYLKNKGYRVLRFWEKNIYEDIENCIEKIREYL